MPRPKLVVQTAFKIDKDVPLPGRSNRPKYPFAEMGIGNSFFAPVHPSRLSTAANHAGERLGFKFTVRKADGGVRVWRIA